MPSALRPIYVFFLLVAQAMNEEQRITVCKTGLIQIYSMLRTAPERWPSYITLGRSIVANLDSTTFMQQPTRTTEQAWMITGIQHLAFADVDSGGVPDLAAWATRQWLQVFQREPQNVAALRGIGHAWLSRAQPILARIHRADNSSSSSGGSQRSVRSRASGGHSDDDRHAAAATAEAERRTGTEDYVEARALLQPATEYFERAVGAAFAQGTASGDLLAMAAEAYMSLGNTSSPRTNERYFRRALQLLRAASSIEGYTLTRYLQQYLDDYGRLLD